MQQCSLTYGSKFWSKKEIQQIRRYRQQLRQISEKENKQKIISKDANQMNFYNITPKQELPKVLQRMQFKTLNSVESTHFFDAVNAPSFVKVFHKQNISSEEESARKKLKKEGQIMLLSEIYQSLDDSLSEKDKKSSLSYKTLKCQFPHLSNVISDLDDWQKSNMKKKNDQILNNNNNNNKGRKYISCDENKKNNRSKEMVKKFKIGSDYKADIEKNLEIIYAANANDQNIQNKYTNIQANSKSLMRELEDMKELIQRQIQEKMKKLEQSRKQHHYLFQEKQRILKQQMAAAQGREDIINLSYSLNSSENQARKKSMVGVDDKNNQIQLNLVKIKKIKKMIEFFQEEINKNQEELKNIIAAEKKYYLVSLKKGIDCRDTGLFWITKNLGLQQKNISHFEFPQFFDKKSKAYLLKRTILQDVLESLMKEKRLFVNEIERRKSIRRRSSGDLMKNFTKNSKLQFQYSIKATKNDRKYGRMETSKKYLRSTRKMSSLLEEFDMNQGLMKLSTKKSEIQFGKNIAEMSAKKIYESAGKRMREIDFSKLRKKHQQKGKDKIFEYQNILKSIEAIHNQLEDIDHYHEQYLLHHYHDQRETFFSITAACFGIKKAYTLIVKNFSWNNQN